MQSISNLSRQFFREILKEKNLELLRSKADTLLKKLLEQSRNALKVSAQKASDFLKNDDLVITASLSRAVFETLKVAKKQGKRFEVCICESRSGKYSYGRLMGKLLSKSRIPNRIIEDENINRLKGADMILIGADSFFRNGSVINGTPSYNLALWGKSKGIPIYVVCESFKEGGRRPKNLQEGFDLIPPKLVKAIITEKWIRYPSSKKSCKDLRIAKER
jgi:translation initiation factor 2B subunit (eIF-2B alpha/beta/delta family)